MHATSTPPAIVDETTGVVVNSLLMGHSHSREFKTGVTYYLVFENPGNLVQRGSRVSVLLGDAQVQHVPVQPSTGRARRARPVGRTLGCGRSQSLRCVRECACRPGSIRPPRSGAVLSGDPAVVHLWFTEEISPDTAPLDWLTRPRRAVSRNSNDRERQPIPRPALPALPTGAYGVLWQVLSQVDWTSKQGALVFSVGAPGQLVSPSVASGPTLRPARGGASPLGCVLLAGRRPRRVGDRGVRPSQGRNEEPLPTLRDGSTRPAEGSSALLRPAR